uniref:Lon peptidase 2, peroxisomal n=1 Tax=Callorhinchus milii TaxID=7868 RepID=A0A4W3K7V3_CALMI
MDSSAIQIPSRLPLLLVNEGVLLPGSSVRAVVETSRNLQLVRSRLLRGTSLRSTIIGVVPNTRDPDTEAQELPRLHSLNDNNNHHHNCDDNSCIGCLRPSRGLFPPDPDFTVNGSKVLTAKEAINGIINSTTWEIFDTKTAPNTESVYFANTRRLSPMRFQSLLYPVRSLVFILICRIGTAGIAVQVVGSNWPKPHYTLLITGLCRFHILEVLKEKPYPVAEVEQLDRLEQYTNGSDAAGELNVLSEQFYEYAIQLVELLDMSVPVVAKLRRMLDSLPKETLPDILASIIRTSANEKLQVLDAVGLEERFKKTIPLLVRQIEGLKLLKKTRKLKLDDEKRVVTIRPIRRNNSISGKRFPLDTAEEEEDDDVDDIIMLEKKIRNANIPEQALKVCMKEIKRLKNMPQSMPEFVLTRNYLELMVELPWKKSTSDRLDLHAARVLLDNDHYAMQELKKRVLEYLAVRQLKNNLKGPILCFVGPPGVGKTSVGRSIAKTLGREFHRISLGGVSDQSYIRGHRRTYVGSMPGRIINGLKSVGVNNPVFLLDEIDKMGRGLQGDPAAALLEVLDPEQNHSFTDHYLNVSFDLSQVLFIATANTTATIPPALLDRMELIQVAGYMQEDKVEIALRHLIPKQLDLHGLTPHHLQIPQETTEDIISRYTREAGVRSLERKIAAICRAVAVKVAESQHRSAKSSHLPWLPLTLVVVHTCLSNTQELSFTVNPLIVQLMQLELLKARNKIMNEAGN